MHDREYIALISETAGRATALDADTFTSPDSYEVALLAAGAAIEASSTSLTATGRRALALVRPPGHHAERNRAMGFCLYNNIAVAAAARARARRCARRHRRLSTCITATARSGCSTTTRGALHLFASIPVLPGHRRGDEIGSGEGAGLHR